MSTEEQRKSQLKKITRSEIQEGLGEVSREIPVEINIYESGSDYDSDALVEYLVFKGVSPELAFGIAISFFDDFPPFRDAFIGAIEYDQVRDKIFP